MKRWKKWLLAALLVLALCLALVYIWPWIAFAAAEEVSVGIIGSADGPTSILVGKIVP